MAIPGGMGRTRNGSYAQLVTVPAANVAAVPSSLGWADLAAVPEVYATAWYALFDNLRLQPGIRVLIRGATSSLGQAAVNLAVDHGAKVLATTRTEAHAPLLKRLLAEHVLIDDGDLADSNTPTTERPENQRLPGSARASRSAPCACRKPRPWAFPTGACRPD